MQQSQVTLLENQASRKKTKQFFILFFILLFTLIISAIISAFTVLKRHAESQSLSANPILAVESACRVTYNYRTCIRSLSSLQNQSHKIYPSDILGLSIRSVFHEFSTISTLPQELASKIENNNIKPALIDCQNLLVDSLNQLNRSQNVEIIDCDEEMVQDLRILMAQAKNSTTRCLHGLHTAAAAAAAAGTPLQQILRLKKVKMRIMKAEIYVLNSLDILEKKGEIDAMFGPNFGSILGSFMLDREYYVLSVVLLCLQYLATALLFCVLVRVFMSRTRI
ncbi:Pectinesterase [Handroanthus impetiginosus]|uniref:Pectinesterase n=1 Tax=Handroanthus impetiginosus TaxID=429701 RepID=A0A2G9GDH2_9LAMI|nr:Pectinesterase [Handroanthus impetiginosus]